MVPRLGGALRILGWIELVVAAPLLWILVRTISELFWPQDTNPTHGEWLPLVVPVVALLFLSALLPGVAAVRHWRHPWWWQILAAFGVAAGVLLAVM
jgi:hypothetical protein